MGGLFGDAEVDHTGPRISRLREVVRKCVACQRPAGSRSNVGRGCTDKPKVAFFVTQPYGLDAMTGELLSGAPGALFSRMLTAVGLKESEVWLGTTVACRRLGVPDPKEFSACAVHWKRSLKILMPLIVVAMGPGACGGLTGNTPEEVMESSYRRLRGTWQELNGIPLRVMPSPSMMLKAPRSRIDAFKDLEAVMERLWQITGETR